MPDDDSTHPAGLETVQPVCFVGDSAAVPKPRHQRLRLWTPSSAALALTLTRPFRMTERKVYWPPHASPLDSQIFVARFYLVLYVVAMNPSQMLTQAKAAPEKRGLNAYLETIWELRRKGNSYREIAEFLNERGLTTDHTAVYRLMMASNPLLDYRDGCVVLGDLEYESRKGRPLRPFSAGLIISIKKQLRIIPLKNAAPMAALWCEAQFELNEAPNYAWLHQLCKCLHIDWNRDLPCDLQSHHGLELKFEGNLMAMVCQTFNLEARMHDVGTSVKEATHFFEQGKEHFSRRDKMLSERRSEILKTVVIRPNESEDEAYEDSLKWNRKDAEQLTKRFTSIPIP